MKTLLEIHNCPQFLIKEVSLTDCVFTFEVYEVNSWGPHNTPIEDDMELYVKGSIKWDGCSHIYFTDYLHLCGKYYFDAHCEMMKALFDYASKVIKNFDMEVAT